MNNDNINAQYIFNLLNELPQEERAKFDQLLKPNRNVNNYKFMIWKQENEDKVLLHCVRRNNATFREVNKIRKDVDKCWFYRENLSPSMPIQRDIKRIVRENFTSKECEMSGNSIVTFQQHLEKLHELITKYFDEYQD